MSYNLAQKIDTAMAWGRPDNESLGYTANEFIKLLYECKQEINRLERILIRNEIPYQKESERDI
jgi:hypothetical protein